MTRPASAAGDCAKFVADVTIPDGTLVSPGQRIEKIWRLTNCGDTTWDGYRAVKSTATFGPDNFVVPMAKPGETIDIAVEMEAPATLGEHWASYRLRGPTTSFGGMGVVVDVADCDLAEPPGLGKAGGEVRALALGRDDIGAGWCAVHGDSGRRWWQALYGAGAYGVPRRVQLWVSVWPDVAWAEQAMPMAPRGAMATEAGPNIVDLGSDDPQIGDGESRRVRWTLKGSTLSGVDYIFRVNRAVGWVQVSGEGDIAADLDPRARELVEMQVARMRGQPDLAGTAARRPAADTLFRALLDTSVETDILSPGLIASRMREVEPAAEPGVPSSLPIAISPADRPRPQPRQSAPVGISELLVRDSRDVSLPPGHVLFVVFQTDAEAREEFVKRDFYMEYLHLPMSGGHPTLCSWGQCVILDGNTVVRSVGAPNGIDAPGWGVYDPESLDTLTLVRAGAEHLDAVLDKLMSQEP